MPFCGQVFVPCFPIWVFLLLLQDYRKVLCCFRCQKEPHSPRKVSKWAMCRQVRSKKGGSAGGGWRPGQPHVTAALQGPGWQRLLEVSKPACHCATSLHSVTGFSNCTSYKFLCTSARTTSSTPSFVFGKHNPLNPSTLSDQ